MGSVIIFETRETVAKGVDKGAMPNQEKIKKYLFDDEYENVALLADIPSFPLVNVRLFYPGCGVDILHPLLYIEALFPLAEEISLILADTANTIQTIKTILDEMGVSFAEEWNRIEFYWRKKLIFVEFVCGDVFTQELPSFNVYFEKAFRIIKDEEGIFERRVFEKLDEGGVIISDSGFYHVPLRRIDAPHQLSAYGEMVIGVKNSGLTSHSRDPDH